MNIHDTITNAPNDARVIIESANATDIFTILDLKKVIHKMYDRGLKDMREAVSRPDPSEVRMPVPHYTAHNKKNYLD